MKKAAAFLLLPVLITSGRADAEPPKIHARWDNGVQQPIKNVHYTIEGTADLPDVLLNEGRNDWRVWSTDLDAADGVGDIGTISSPINNPFNANFTLKLAANGSADHVCIGVPHIGTHQGQWHCNRQSRRGMRTNAE